MPDMPTTKPPGCFPVLCTLIALVFPLAAMAHPEKGSEFNIAASLLHFDYQEFNDAGKLLLRENGFIPGLMLGMSQTSERWVFAGDFAFHGGDVLYTGQTQTGIPITTRTTQNIVDIAMRTEYWIDDKQSLNYALYLGAGYHYWKRDILPTTTAGGKPVSGLLEVYTWWSGFLGMKAEIYQSATSRWLLDARLMQTIKPTIAIDFNGRFDNATLALGERLGFRLALPSRYTINRSTSLNIEPYAESYELGRSKASPLTKNGAEVGTVFEPYSKTINYGLSVGISQHF